MNNGHPKNGKTGPYGLPMRSFRVTNAIHREIHMDMMVLMFAIMTGKKDTTVPIRPGSPALSASITIMSLAATIAPVV